MELPGLVSFAFSCSSILFPIFIRKKRVQPATPLENKRQALDESDVFPLSLNTKHNRLYFAHSREIPVEHHATFFHITDELLHGRLLPTAERLKVLERSSVVVVRVPQGRTDREPHGIVRDRHPPRSRRVNAEFHVHAFHLLDQFIDELNVTRCTIVPSTGDVQPEHVDA